MQVTFSTNDREISTCPVKVLIRIMTTKGLASTDKKIQRNGQKLHFYHKKKLPLDMISINMLFLPLDRAITNILC